jgi:hypothetical protein
MWWGLVAGLAAVAIVLLVRVLLKIRIAPPEQEKPGAAGFGPVSRIAAEVAARGPLTPSPGDEPSSPS